MGAAWDLVDRGQAVGSAFVGCNVFHVIVEQRRGAVAGHDEEDVSLVAGLEGVIPEAEARPVHLGLMAVVAGAVERLVQVGATFPRCGHGLWGGDGEQAVGEVCNVFHDVIRGDGVESEQAVDEGDEGLVVVVDEAVGEVEVFAGERVEEVGREEDLGLRAFFDDGAAPDDLGLVVLGAGVGGGAIAFQHELAGGLGERLAGLGIDGRLTGGGVHDGSLLLDELVLALDDDVAIAADDGLTVRSDEDGFLGLVVADALLVE